MIKQLVDIRKEIGVISAKLGAFTASESIQEEGKIVHFPLMTEPEVESLEERIDDQKIIIYLVSRQFMNGILIHF